MKQTDPIRNRNNILKNAWHFARLGSEMWVTDLLESAQNYAPVSERSRKGILKTLKENKS